MDGLLDVSRFLGTHDNTIRRPVFARAGARALSGMSGGALGGAYDPPRAAVQITPGPPRAPENSVTIVTSP
jgi:hypothetical protein